MKKIIFLVILLSFISISNVFAISEEEAKEYIGRNVFVVLSNFITPCGLYGVPIDVIDYKGEWYLVLKTYYRQTEEQFIKCKNIHYIRERYNGE
jgi:hypothetical protein